MVLDLVITTTFGMAMALEVGLEVYLVLEEADTVVTVEMAPVALVESRMGLLDSFLRHPRLMILQWALPVALPLTLVAQAVELFFLTLALLQLMGVSRPTVHTLVLDVIHFREM